MTGILANFQSVYLPLHQSDLYSIYLSEYFSERFPVSMYKHMLNTVHTNSLYLLDDLKWMVEWVSAGSTQCESWRVCTALKSFSVR